MRNGMLEFQNFRLNSVVRIKKTYIHTQTHTHAYILPNIGYYLKKYFFAVGDKMTKNKYII